MQHSRKLNYTNKINGKNRKQGKLVLKLSSRSWCSKLPLHFHHTVTRTRKWKYSNIFFPWVGIEPTTCHAYSLTLVPLSPINNKMNLNRLEYFIKIFLYILFRVHSFKCILLILYKSFIVQLKILTHDWNPQLRQSATVV